MRTLFLIILLISGVVFAGSTRIIDVDELKTADGRVSTTITQNLIPLASQTLGTSTSRWLTAYIQRFRDGSNVQAMSITNRELNDPAGASALSFNSTLQVTVSKNFRPTPGNTYTSGSTGGDWLSVYTRKLQSVDDLILEVPNGKVFKILEVSNTPSINDVWKASATDGTSYWEPIAPKHTSDPCGTLAEGIMFYNDTSNYFCYCDGTNDVQMHSPATACF